MQLAKIAGGISCIGVSAKSGSSLCHARMDSQHKRFSVFATTVTVEKSVAAHTLSPRMESQVLVLGYTDAAIYSATCWFVDTIGFSLPQSYHTGKHPERQPHEILYGRLWLQIMLDRLGRFLNRCTGVC